MRQVRFLRLDAVLIRQMDQALEERAKLPLAERREAPTPKVATTSRRAALLWVLRTMNQDEPVLLWAGAVAVTTYFAYLLCAGIIRLAS